jgi:hypothetical protein
VVAVGVNGPREATVRRRVGAIEEVGEGTRPRRRGVGLAVAGAAACNRSIRRASIVHGEGGVGRAEAGDDVGNRGSRRTGSE